MNRISNDQLVLLPRFEGFVFLYSERFLSFNFEYFCMIELHLMFHLFTFIYSHLIVCVISDEFI